MTPLTDEEIKTMKHWAEVSDAVSFRYHSTNTKLMLRLLREREAMIEVLNRKNGMLCQIEMVSDLEDKVNKLTHDCIAITPATILAEWEQKEKKP